MSTLFGPGSALWMWFKVLVVVIFARIVLFYLGFNAYIPILDDLANMVIGVGALLYSVCRRILPYVFP